MIPDALAFLLVLAALGLALMALLIAGMAITLLRPARMTDAKALYVLKRLTPEDLNLEYKTLTFMVRDQRSGKSLRLAAWWIAHPRPSARCAVLIHGYSDAKVGAIAWAPMFQRLGFNVLAVDLRAHGDSEGRFSTAGFFERQDIDAILNQLRAERPAETREIVLFGISLGAAVATAVAAGRDDISALILECPYADFRHAVAAHGKLRGLPGGMLREAAMRLAEWISGADFNDVRPVDLIRDVRCPIMVLQAGDDPFVWSEDRRAIEHAMQAHARKVPALCVSIETAPHVMALATEPEMYEKRIAEFLRCAEEKNATVLSSTVCPAT